MKLAGAVLIIVILGVVILVLWLYVKEKKLVSPAVNTNQEIEKPLLRYTYDALSKTNFKLSEITLGKVISDKEDFISRIFYIDIESKKVSGLVNYPKAEGVYPIVVMFRGYVDKEMYTTGIGTQRAGEEFVKNGFITIAPDFLGYGESDNPSENPMEERFQTYVTALTLLVSVNSINNAFEINAVDTRADADNISIWGHSNGGQIALTILEVAEKNYPTVLWAPVSKPFPYSILFYTDEFDDRGKMLRRVIAEFEQDYDVENYSLTNYLKRINAPIQIHQGSADDAVPIDWSEELVDKLKDSKKDVEYFTYTGADHNLIPNGWQLAVNRSIEFYQNKATKN
ncbi:hypothetical protein A2164_03625 [Candidatus Curtissbacteria bacterium RBG_13_35_7]|uniref:Peptidase S9 prolyl oligopeptidase catalytic domain-containing protein n=1 Tax=Candidatus Curtissbacteria bacterium RBG_13_35_7 TaxID=1797705 RepID=A0A1F5G3P4_9BACT|nr:MAG: hypothetical protein A2164_03625 [Candidatus Curtissbacteria bacterium RBG_13_35_7]